MTLNQWIVNGETGISSKTLWAVFSGVETEKQQMDSFGTYDVPKDGDDFRRCCLFVNQCELKDRLHEVVEVFPAWAPFIDNWDELEEMLDNDLPTYDFVSDLENISKTIDGWKLKGCAWSRDEILTEPEENHE